MMYFINTRPQARAHALNEALTAQGVKVLALPLLELNELAFDTTLDTLFAQLPQVQAIIVVSPSAVQIGMRYLQQAGVALSALAQVHWVAVGQSTAQALALYGIQSEVPQVETSEGMLQLHALTDAHLNTVAVWRGVGGRQFMLAQLQQRGVRVLNFLLYDRQCPSTAAAQLQTILVQLPALSRPFILMSSEASWRNWLSIQQHDAVFIYAVRYLVLGQRLANIVQQHALVQQQHIDVTVLSTLQAAEVYWQMRGGVLT